MAVLPTVTDLPRQHELEAQFLRFWIAMRRNLHGHTRRAKLDFSEERRAKNLAADAYERRLRESGLGSVKNDALKTLTALACQGGKLVGPSTVEGVHQLAAALHAESGWMRDVSAWIMRQMLRNLEEGTRGFSLPPVILVGPPGIGKSHYARTLANVVGAPVRMIDVGGGSAGFRISGTEKGWGSEQPGLPVETILATRVANPLMVVDEIDKAGIVRSTRGTSTSITTSLLQMLEPGTARHFECSYYRVPFDMSRVVWIMTANDLDGIPAPLRDRSRLFILPKLSAADAVAHFDRLTSDCTDEAERVRCRMFISDMCARPNGISLRQIRQLADVLRAPVTPLVH